VALSWRCGKTWEIKIILNTIINQIIICIFIHSLTAPHINAINTSGFMNFSAKSFSNQPVQLPPKQSMSTQTLSDLAIIILSESEFQDYIRSNQYHNAGINFNKIETILNDIIKNNSQFSDSLQNAILIIIENIKKSLIAKNSMAADSFFNQLIKKLYECYYYFPINDSPEINYYYVDILQFENYHSKRDWRLMTAECEEMLDFFDCIASRFQTEKLRKPYNLFLLKYFKISLTKLKNAVLDKDEKTLQEAITGFKEIISKFQNIYIR